jgi:hypothetical protein
MVLRGRLGAEVAARGPRARYTDSSWRSAVETEAAAMLFEYLIEPILLPLCYLYRQAERPGHN